MSATIVVMLAFGACLGFALGVAARRLPPGDSGLAARIDALLPQNQCAQCGYPGCRAFARALAEGRTDIDRCPPGGQRLVRELAQLLGREPEAWRAIAAPAPPPAIAAIDESRCIGCALCLPACPVDAIVGAPRYLHTVLRTECTGCGLCLPACPVDCIVLTSADTPMRAGVPAIAA